MNHPPTTRDFPKGTRVRLRTHRNQLVSLGMSNLVVNLGKRPYVTGVIYNQIPAYMHDFADFRPDGWPLPEDVAPTCFGANVHDMENWAGETWPCVMTGNLGEKVSPADVERLVDEHARQWRENHKSF